MTNDARQPRTTTTPSRLEKNGSLMAASRVLRNLVMVLREKEEVLENTQRQLRQKEKECDELKDQCLALRLENKSLCYIMLCQDCRPYLDSKRPGDAAEDYSCPSCIGVAVRPREFPRYTKTEEGRESITKLGPIVFSFVLVLALLIFVWPFLPLFNLLLTFLALLWPVRSSN